MAKQQRTEVAPPLDIDKGLLDFSAIVQSNFVDLFQSAHDHQIRTSIPGNSEGNIGDIIPVFQDPSWYLYIKISSDTWKRTAALV